VVTQQQRQQLSTMNTHNQKPGSYRKLWSDDDDDDDDDWCFTATFVHKVG